MGVIALGKDLNRSLKRLDGFCVQLWTLFGVMSCFVFFVVDKNRMVVVGGGTLEPNE